MKFCRKTYPEKNYNGSYTVVQFVQNIPNKFHCNVANTFDKFSKNMFKIIFCQHLVLWMRMPLKKFFSWQMTPFFKYFTCPKRRTMFHSVFVTFGTIDVFGAKKYTNLIRFFFGSPLNFSRSIIQKKKTFLRVSTCMVCMKSSLYFAKWEHKL